MEQRYQAVLDVLNDGVSITALGARDFAFRDPSGNLVRIAQA